MRRPVALVVLAMLAACAEPSEPAAGDPTGIAWELESGMVDGGPLPIVATHHVTLSFDEEGAGGTAACNRYGGAYTISGSAITFSELFQTEMGCIPEEIMESEQLYLEGLARVDRFSMGENRFTLSGDSVELVFHALPPVPTAELTGTVWALDGLVQGESVSSVGGERATLELFSDGSLLASTGCRSLNGHYAVSGAEVSVTGLAAEGECPSELVGQDSLVVTVLGDGFRVEIQGNTLALNSSDAEGLLYIEAE
jgi:heat shock protein HslJ